MQMQYRASAVDNLKIATAMISFMENTKSCMMVDQNGRVKLNSSSG